MAIELSELPYKENALEPYISARTLSFHYGKHHQGYVDKLNDAVKESELQHKPLDQIILRSKYAKDKATFNNADTPMVHDCQPLVTLDVWEHAYYLDYQNDRASYVDAFLDHLVDWEFARNNLNIVSNAA